MFRFAIFIFISAGLLWLLMLKLNVSVEYKRNDWDDYMVLSVYMLNHIIKYKIEIPLIDVDLDKLKLKEVRELGKKEKDISEKSTAVKLLDMLGGFLRYRELLESYRSILSYIWCAIRKRLCFEQINLDVRFGVSNPAYTGILTGLIWSLAGSVITYIDNSFNIANKKASITPDFNSCILRIDFICIFNIKIVHIIIVFAKVVFMFGKELLKKFKVAGGDLVERASN